MPKHKEFQFRGFDFDAKTGVAQFVYGFDGGRDITETLIFPGSNYSLYNVNTLEEALKLYWLVAGVSYYKAHYSPEIGIQDAQIDGFQADFLNNLYLHGLGEYLYKNKLDPTDIAFFVANSETISLSVDEHTPQPTPNRSVLLPIGGGKDSLVAAHLLTEAGVEYTAFRINPVDWVEKQISRLEVPALYVKRSLDPYVLGEEPEFNGHVPVTAIVSAAAIITSVLYNFDDVVLSNEAAADIPNMHYKGIEINHQYSKSHVVEQDIRTWLKNYIKPEGEFYSLLRDKSSLEISKLFAENCFDEFQGLWSSSNDNFKVGENRSAPGWDPHSPKTLSVFAMLAAHLPPEKIIPEFGADLFADPENETTWAQLTGKQDIKPFECVAATEEVTEALILAARNWPSAQRYL